VWRQWLAATFATLTAISIFMTCTTAVAAPAQIPARYQTSTPVPLGCTELIRNGNFETLFDAWVLSSGPRPPQYVSPPRPVFAGSRSMQVGIVDLPNVFSDSFVFQDVTLPSGPQIITVSFHYYPQFTSAPSPTAVQYARVEQPAGGLLASLLNVQSNSQTWIPVVQDISSLAGQTVRLKFGAFNDGANGSMAMWLDNVSILVCPVAPTATATWTPTPTWTPPPFITPLPPLTPPGGACPGQITNPCVVGLPAGSICQDFVYNGGFEAPDAGTCFKNGASVGNWCLGEDPVPPALSGPPYKGGRSARLGISPNLGIPAPGVETFSSVRQLIDIPANANFACLTWYHQNGSEEGQNLCPGPGQDRQDVILLYPDNETAAILYRTRTTEGTWVGEQRNMIQYAGQPLQLYFNVFNDGAGGRTWQFIDDVVLQVCYPPPTPTPTATHTPLPTHTPTPTPTPTATVTPTLAPLLPEGGSDTAAFAAAGPVQGEPVVEAIGGEEGLAVRLIGTPESAPGQESDTQFARLWDLARPVGTVAAVVGAIAFFAWGIVEYFRRNYG
jgi:hypothetical protein